LQHYQGRFRQILVDEFQDTNAVQYAWLRVLAGDSFRSSRSGDDDQSIYGWRGARIENIQRFSEDFKATKTIRLEQNYRSTQGPFCRRRTASSPTTSGAWARSCGPRVRPVSRSACTPATTNTTRRAISSMRPSSGHSAGNNAQSSVAILYRSNAQSRVLEEALIRSGMSLSHLRRPAFLRAPRDSQRLAYLRLLLNRGDDAAVERVINTPPRGIGGKTLDTVRECARGARHLAVGGDCAVLAEKALPARALSALAVCRR
jgi:DNA helicase-2/ATP-dependent DNA helicase PcrA